MYESLTEVTAVIEKVKNIAKWLKQSVVGSDELRKKTERKLIQSVTKWNSTVYMLNIEFATTEATGERFATSSSVISFVKMMGSKTNCVSCCLELGKKTERSVPVQYKKKFDSIENSQFFALASLLDPRFKILHFKNKILKGTWKKNLNIIIVDIKLEKRGNHWILMVGSCLQLHLLLGVHKICKIVISTIL
ncbi:hypothetical protein NPIL_443311 [Nephila pilipes]|uniref:Uncharacterized protein n=1 Tax=Nephila pilipes TaxID=299642 RepID=A0A8X6QNI3_NEPPI|nr:hypothetical protein NPIL_443311 [Nephila pilipes]